MTVLERYFAALDGPEPVAALDCVSDAVRFAALFSTDAGSYNRQFLGGRAELAAYIEQRGDPGWRHDVLGAGADGPFRLAWGETRRADGTLAATFVAAARVDDQGLIDRLLCGRTPAITFPAPA